MIEKIKPYWGGLLAILAMGLKTILFYHLIEVDTNRTWVILVTWSYLALGYAILPKKRYAKSGFYWFCSILMFADVIYFKYFNQILSVRLLSQTGQLGTVTDVIFLLITPKELLLVGDCLLILCLKKFNKLHLPSIPVAYKSFGIGVLAFFIGLVGFNVLGIKDLRGISHQEFYTYHLLDVADVVKAEANEGDVKDRIEAKNIPAMPKDAYYGLGKDKNLIVIQVESLQDMVIQKDYEGQELTPHLNQLIADQSLYFNNYYQQLGKGNTSDAEFVTQNSLYASMKGQSYVLFQDNQFYGLPWITRDYGYSTMVMHGYKKAFWNREKAYPNQGFQQFIGEEDFKLDETIGFGLTDESFFKQAVPYLKSQKSPFYSFMITLTSHTPFKMPADKQKLKLKPSDEGTYFGDYLQSVHYTDMAIGKFIEDLKKEGLYDNTVIAIYGDHFGISSKKEDVWQNVTDFIGRPYDFDEMMNIPLIIHVPGMEKAKTIETTGGQIDFLPTILHLMGMELKTPYVFGKDLLVEKSGFVASQTYMVEGSFLAKEVVLEMSRDTVYENSRAWNRQTGKKLDPQAYRRYYERAKKEITESNYILENNMIENQR